MKKARPTKARPSKNQNVKSRSKSIPVSRIIRFGQSKRHLVSNRFREFRATLLSSCPHQFPCFRISPTHPPDCSFLLNFLPGFRIESNVGVHFVESHAQHEAARRLFSRGGGRANRRDRGMRWPRDFAGVRYEVSDKGSTTSSIEPLGGGRSSVCRRRPKRLMPAVSQP